MSEPTQSECRENPKKTGMNLGLIKAMCDAHV